MRELTRRDALKLTATAGAAVGGVLALGATPANAADPEPLKIVRIQIDSEKTKLDGGWCHVWIVTDSRQPPLVCLADTNWRHFETIAAAVGEEFKDLPDKPLGVRLMLYSKHEDAPESGKGFAVNLLQMGAKRYIVQKPV